MPSAPPAPATAPTAPPDAPSPDRGWRPALPLPAHAARNTTRSQAQASNEPQHCTGVLNCQQLPCTQHMPPPIRGTRGTHTPACPPPNKHTCRGFLRHTLSCRVSHRDEVPDRHAACKAVGRPDGLALVVIQQPSVNQGLGSQRQARGVHRQRGVLCTGSDVHQQAVDKESRAGTSTEQQRNSQEGQRQTAVQQRV